MAGNLREYPMPGNPVTAKKRDRVDAQDDLWKKTGLQPMQHESVGGKMEDDAAEAARKKRDQVVDEKAAQVPGEKLLQDPEVLAAQEDYLQAAARAFETRSPPTGGGTNTPLQQTIEFAESVLQMGLSYVHEFVGMVATGLADRDVRRYYKWRGKGASLSTLQSPLELEGVNTIQDLIRKNMHLGRDMCAVFLQQYKLFEEKAAAPKGGNATDDESEINNQLIGADNSLDTLFRFNVQRYGDLLDQLLATDGVEDATGGFVNGTKRDWVFGLLDLSAFAFILDAGTMGAMSLAVGKIKRIRGCERFTLKQLLMSEQVRDIFAIFVSYQYLLASGGNAYAGRSGTSAGMAKGTTFMLSAGIATRQMLASQVETAQYWFQDVYESANPVYQQLDARKNALLADRQRLVPGTQQAVINAVDNIRLNNLPDALGLLERVAQNPGLSAADRAFVENVRNVYRLEQLLARIPPRILVHAN